MTLSYDVISIIYGLAGAITFFRLVKHRHAFFDRIVTREDRHLAWAVSLFLLTPLGVLAHEAGHHLTAEFYGATNVELHHHGYWGFVTYNGVLDSTTHLKIAASGPIVGALLGYLSLGVAMMFPIPTIFRHVIAIFGFLEIFHHLIGYPLIDIVSGLQGDFHTIYSFLPFSWAVLAGIFHLTLLALFYLAWQHPTTQNLLRR